MARGSFNVDGNVFRTTTPAFSSEPFTMACWLYVTALANTDFFTVGNNATDVHQLRVTSSGFIRCASFVGTGGSSTTTSAVSVNTWAHAAGVWSASNSRTAYLNGTAAATNTTNVNVTPLDELAIGGNYGQTIRFQGYLANVAVWNAALSAAEIASLAKGFAAHLVRPASLVHYMPLVRSDVGLKGAVPPTGTINVFPNPPIIGAIAV